MKRKFLLIVTLIVALVMSFALAACGPAPEKDKDNDTPKKFTSQMMETALDKIQESKGIKGTVEYTLKSDANTTGTTAGGSFEKRAKEVKFVESGANGKEFIFNFDTGYLYEKKTGGYEFKQAIPAGIKDFIAPSLGDEDIELDADDIDAFFDENTTYDGATRTLTATLDAKAEVNQKIAPLNEAYSDGRSLAWLIDEYLEEITGDSEVTIEAILDSLVALYNANADKTLGDVMEKIEEIASVDLDDLLKNQLKLGDDLIALVKARKIKEVAAGITLVVNDIMSDPEEALAVIMGDDDEAREEFINGAISKILFEEVTDENIASASDMIDEVKEMAVNYLDNTTFKSLIDGMKAGDIKTMIKEGVNLTKLEATFTVKFDEKGAITEMTFEGDVAHSYTGAKTGLTVLADNNYNIVATVAISEYLAEAADTFDKTFASVSIGDIEGADSASAIIAYYDTTKTSYTVYFETGSDTAAVTGIALVYETEEDHATLTATATYASSSKTFTIPRAAVTEFVGKTDRVGSSLTVAFDVGDTACNIELIIIEKDPFAAQPAA